jgi:VIT1/CCC1 family predicted Fe2+/Mn2+ transporter
MEAREPRTDLWMQTLLDERDGAALYEGLAALEKDPGKAQSFREIALAERRHGDVWVRRLQKAGVPLPPDRASSRVRALLWLARRLGTSAVLPMVMDAEEKDADKYLSMSRGGDSEAEAIAAEEHAHRAVLQGMGKGESTEARSLIAERERWHRSGRAGSIRAAIFGMNDGLLSNFSLVLGVAGAGVGGETILVTGLAGILAGASSMAVGEYTSVASQRDLLARQIELERREVAEAPEEEAAELALIFKQKGLSTEQASRTAAEILKNPEQAVDTLVREELGLDPSDLGSPWGAASSSFLTFGLGAAIPVLPFLALHGSAAVGLSAALAFTVLGGVGALVGFLAGTSPWRSGGRMVGLGLLAAGITFGVGKLLGVAVG